jgi:hypothetical protein
MPQHRAVALAALALALTTIAGCTGATVDPGVWSRENAGMREITADDVACRRAADTIGTGLGTIVGGFADAIVFGIQEFRRERTYEECMKAKGYARSS